MMIEKINLLKKLSNSENVITICNNAIASLSSTLYENITSEAKREVEKVIIENLFEQLSSIEEPEVKKWLENSKRVWMVKNLGIQEAVNNLSKSEAKENPGLAETLDYFKSKLENTPEVLLYESFITALQSFSYFPKVENAIKAIEDRINTYKSDVNINKIIETMKETRSNYLVPLIEDVVDNYLDNKTEQSKSFLKETLIKFSYDPFVRDIINLVTVDATELQLEYANAECDIEKIYSPVLYLGENEAIFGVKGTYYVKKGNMLSKLEEKNVEKLDPEFKNLCEIINDPNVVISSKDIIIYEGSDKIIITKDKVTINNQEISNEQFEKSAEISEWTGKGNLLRLVETLRKNFNEIAEIEFGKRVYLKEEEQCAADVFKLRDNIFIATHSTLNENDTFYRNVNPIQAKKIMMEHLRYDVSKTFKNLLPDEDKILEEIEETKIAYSSYINDLERKSSEFKLNPFKPEVTVAVVEALEEELKEVKEEYKDYLNIVETYLRVPVSEQEEPITITIQKGDKKYVVPIPVEGAPSGEETGEVGTEVGKDDLENQPASAVTFADDKTELLGDSPSISADQVSLGADEVEADADAAEAEAEEKEKEEEEKPEEEEIKIEDKVDTEEEGEEKEDEEKESEKKKEEEEEEEKKKKNESSVKKEIPKKRKVYLKKKKIKK